MQLPDILIIVFVVLVALFAGLYFLNKWAARKMGDNQAIMEKSKTPATIFVIDKKHAKASEVNLPKVVSEKLPKMYKVMKIYFIMAKIGPQIVTLMCEKKIYNFLAPQKSYKVDIAGIYIVSVKGMKTEAEMKNAAKAKKEKEKADEEREKQHKKEMKKAGKKAGDSK